MIGGYRPTEFTGTGSIEKVRLSRTRVEKDGAGRYRLVSARGREMVLDADLVVIAIGQVPEKASLPPGVLDRQSVKVSLDEYGMTSVPGVYAGGDLTMQRAAVADAILSGKRAALAIHLKANGYDPAQIMPALRLGTGNSLSFQAYSDGEGLDLKRVVQFAELNTLSYRKAAPQAAGKVRPEVRQRTFKEVNPGLTKEAAMEEAKRCFYCGQCIGCDLCFLFCPDVSIVKEEKKTYRILRDYCKGCSICATMCPRHVIEMETR
jgi:NADPH-dependent glutamate synthase beta subunit-like oxidoreductase